MRRIFDQIADRLGYQPKTPVNPDSPAAALGAHIGGLIKDLRVRIEKLEAAKSGTTVTASADHPCRECRESRRS